jgi:hypothetical protein
VRQQLRVRRGLLTPTTLKLKIDRELDSPGAKGRKGLQKAGESEGSGAKNGIDLCHVCPIKKVESFSDDIQLGGLAEWKILQDAKIHVR